MKNSIWLEIPGDRRNSPTWTLSAS